MNKAWVPALGINFHLGVDGISLWLVLLTTLMMPLTLFSPQAIGLRNIRVREFTVAMLVMETGMIGAFLAVDLFLFYVFWELMLIPMYFIIGIWGGERRLYASIKFVIYTLIGLAADAGGHPVPVRAGPRADRHLDASTTPPTPR